MSQHIGAGALRQAARIREMIANHPPHKEGPPSRQVFRRRELIVRKREVATAKALTIKNRRNQRRKAATDTT